MKVPILLIAFVTLLFCGCSHFGETSGSGAQEKENRVGTGGGQFGGPGSITRGAGTVGK
jgi:hypothetical protein